MTSQRRRRARWRHRDQPVTELLPCCVEVFEQESQHAGQLYLLIHPDSSWFIARSSFSQNISSSTTLSRTCRSAPFFACVATLNWQRHSFHPTGTNLLKAHEALLDLGQAAPPHVKCSCRQDTLHTRLLELEPNITNVSPSFPCFPDLFARVTKIWRPSSANLIVPTKEGHHRLSL